jgi:hypothetical protein
MVELKSMKIAGPKKEKALGKNQVLFVFGG